MRIERKSSRHHPMHELMLNMLRNIHILLYYSKAGMLQRKWGESLKLHAITDRDRNYVPGKLGSGPDALQEHSGS